MSRGSAIIAIMIAFVGGFAIGQVTGGGSGDENEVADVRVEAAGEIGARGPEAPTEGAPAPGEVVRYRVPVTADQPSKGPEDALVTIVEVSEFQCPFCARVLPTTSRILNEYRGQVRIVWRNNPLPFHPEAGPAANLAMEAFEQGGSEKFWQVHDILFENQRALSRADLERYAQQAGLDMAQVRAALDNNEHQAKITADQQLAASLGARGTPAFFINGVQLMGAQPFEAFKEVIDREIANARRLVQAGTPARNVYAELIRNGRTSPAPEPNQPAAQPQQPQQQPDPNAVYKIEIQQPMPQRGPDDALVTIVEVSDYECPFCSRVEPTMDRLLEEYPRDVRVVWMNNPLPFHRNAGPAHNLAMEAFEQGGNDKFWRLHELLFANQRELTRENLERWAGEVGLNMAQARAALDNNEHNAVIERQQGVARGVGATGTPSFFINGRNLRGAQPYERFKAMVDEELAKARALVERGTPRGRVYATIIAEGATTPQFIAAPGGAAQPGAAAPAPAPERYEIPVPRNAPTKGAARGARVIIQEFSDFQCPFCGRVNPTIAQILEEYGNQVQIIWRNYPLPFHAQAHLAAQASLEAFRQGGNEKFWAYHDLLFENQRDMERPALERHAEALGLNMAQFRQALDTERHKASVDADMEAVRTAGAQIGTPSFFINGRLLQGAQPFEAFKREIDAALAAPR